MLTVLTIPIVLTTITRSLPRRACLRYGFGTSTRVQANMVYWKGKAGAAEGKDTPGPSYKLKSSVGGQVQSDRRSGSSFGFGSSARFGPPSKDRSPGPGEYNA